MCVAAQRKKRKKSTATATPSTQNASRKWVVVVVAVAVVVVFCSQLYLLWPFLRLLRRERKKEASLLLKSVGFRLAKKEKHAEHW